MLFHEDILKKCIFYLNEKFFIPFTLVEHIDMDVFIKEQKIPLLDETWAIIITILLLIKRTGIIQVVLHIKSPIIKLS